MTRTFGDSKWWNPLDTLSSWKPSSTAIGAATVCAVVCVASLLFLSAVVAGDYERSTTTHPHIAQGQIDAMMSPTHSAASSNNASDCDLLSNLGAGSIPPGYMPNVTVIYSQLCVEPQFVALLLAWGGLFEYHPANGTGTAWGARNLTFGYGGNGSQTIPTIYYSVNWVAGCGNVSFGPGIEVCSYLEYWAGNLSTNSLHGPFSHEYPESSGSGLPIPIPSSSTGGGSNQTPLFSFSNVVTVGSLVIAALVGAVTLVSLKKRKPLTSESIVSNESADTQTDMGGNVGLSKGATPLQVDNSQIDSLDDFF